MPDLSTICDYMRLCVAPHKRRYVATSVMLSCVTKYLFEWHSPVMIAT